MELCAQDAVMIGVADGDFACVKNDRAAIEVIVQISERVRPGVAAIPFGWWSDHHSDGRVANALTNDALTDWGGGVAFSDTLVAITPVKTTP